MASAKVEQIEVLEKNDIQQDLPQELQYKHPLNCSWTLWYFENDRRRTWEENLREIISVNTVEDFWSLYNHIKMASELQHGSDYSLFKKGIRPMWEDPSNKKGGRWLINMDRKNRDKDELDHLWLETLLCMIGEAFDDYGSEVCGAVLNIRNKGDKIALWTADATKTKYDSIIAIGKVLKERLNMPPRNQIGYQKHTDLMEKTGSVARNLLTV